MATEQDWAAYADQAYLATGDTLLARTSAGAGVEVPGAAVLAKRASSNGYATGGDGLAVGLSANKAGTTSIAQVNGDLSLTVGGASALFFNGYFGSGAFRNWNAGLYMGLVRFDPSSGGLQFWTSPATVGADAAASPAIRWEVLAAGHFRPGADNAYSLGTSANRASVVYAGTGTINTSDAREKAWRGAPNAVELAAAREIAAELGFYQWLDAVAEKGANAARLHFGPRAQRVWEIMAAHGLVDPVGDDGRPGRTPYAFLCFDEWEAVEPTSARSEVRDADGLIVARGAPAQPGREAGNRFGIRPDQLALFLIAAQEARLRAIEAAITG